MAEELRIVVVDQGGGAPSRPPSAPAPPPRAPAAPRQEREEEDDGIGAGEATLAPRVLPRAVAGVGAAAAAHPAIAATVVALAGVAVAAGAVVVGFKAVSAVADRLSATVAEQVSELESLSGAVAAAAAATELQQMRARADRARQLGPGLAQAERFRAEREDAQFRLQTELLEQQIALTNALQPVFEVQNEGTELLRKLVDSIGEKLVDLVSNAVQILNPMLDAVTDIIKWLADRFGLDDDEEQRLIDEFTRQFMGQAPRDDDGELLFFGG